MVNSAKRKMKQKGISTITCVSAQWIHNRDRIFTQEKHTVLINYK